MPPRRRAARAAAWDGTRRWWLLAFGALATALLLSPRVARAQGLRSQGASVSLTVVAPPELRAQSAAGRAVVRRGPSVADATLELPSVPFELARVELRASAVDADAATPAATGVHLLVRDAAGTLRPLRDEWVALDVAGRAFTPSLRMVAADGQPLGATRWRVQLRLIPRDPAAAPVQVTRALATGASR